MRRAITLLAFAALAMPCATPLCAQPPAPIPAPVAEQPRPFVAPEAVTRADLARAYMGLDALVRKSKLDDTALAAVNRGFDDATRMFFMGQFSPAIMVIHTLQRALPAEAANPAAADLALTRSLKVTVDPLVMVKAKHENLKLRFTSIYEPPAPIGPDQKLHILLTGNQGRFGINHAAPLTLVNNAIDTCITLPIADLWPGTTARIDISISTDGRTWHPVGHFTIAERAPSQLQAELLKRLDALKPTTDPAVKIARDIARSRVNLLTDEPSASNSAEFLADLPTLFQLLPAEVAEIEHAKNPYTQRPGDWWCAMPLGGSSLPMRIVASDKVLSKAQNYPPLVIALHGFGGDENMFPDALGAGLIKDLAISTPFILVSPKTDAVMSRTENFPALLAFIRSIYAFDENRIYVIGHSMGAGGAAVLSRREISTIAAVVCIAGGPQRPIAKPVAPMLVIAGGLDPIAGAAPLKRAADTAKAAGFPIDYIAKPNHGHTFVVGDSLSEAVAWLLTHKLDKAERQRWLDEDAAKRKAPIDKPPADPKLSPPPGAVPPVAPAPPK